VDLRISACIYPPVRAAGPRPTHGSTRTTRTPHHGMSRARRTAVCQAHTRAHTREHTHVRTALCRLAALHMASIHVKVTQRRVRTHLGRRGRHAERTCAGARDLQTYHGPRVPMYHGTRAGARKTYTGIQSTPTMVHCTPAHVKPHTCGVYCHFTATCRVHAHLVHVYSSTVITPGARPAEATVHCAPRWTLGKPVHTYQCV